MKKDKDLIHKRIGFFFGMPPREPMSNMEKIRWEETKKRFVYITPEMEELEVVKLYRQLQEEARKSDNSAKRLAMQFTTLIWDI